MSSNVMSINKYRKPGILKNGSVTINGDDEVIASGFEFKGVNLDEASRLILEHALKVLTKKYHGIH